MRPETNLERGNKPHHSDARQHAGRGPSLEKRLKSLPPPPPLAAFVQRTDRPLAATSATVPAMLPQPTAAALPSVARDPADWSVAASDHFASSVAPKSASNGWGSVMALGALGVAGVIGAGFALHAVHIPVPTLRPETALIAPARPLARPQLLAATFKAAMPSSEDEAAEVAREPHIINLPVQELMVDVPRATPTDDSRPRHVREATKVAPAPESETSQASEPVAPAEAEQEAEDDLPPQPSREEIKQAMESARSSLELCTASAHGVALANVKIAGNGRVSYSTIGGAFGGTPQGSCMARALRTVQFPRFSAKNLSVTYPFQF